MDGDRFDTWARRLSTPTSRRATVGAAVTGGFLSALGLTRAVPEAAAQGGTCVVTFAAQVRQGASTQQPLVPGGRAGEVRGDLSFSLSRSGSLDNATLTLADGTSLPVVGDAAGHSLQLRIALGARQALVAVGVGEQEIARCQGAIDGVVTGAAAGELGDWHATAGQQAAGQQTAGSSEQGSGKKKDRANAAAGGAAGAGSNPGRAPRGNQGAGGQGGAQGGGGNPGGRGTQGANTPSCAAGLTGCGDACVNLQLDSGNCGACGQGCAAATPICSGSRCVTTEDAGPIQNCAPPFAFCDGVCVNLQADPLNCGACGTACAADETCAGGTCAPGATGGGACPEGQVRCGGACTDALPNFGSDGISCPGGAPPSECPAGRVLCNGACFPDGACQPAECQPGWGYCYGVCRDFQNDPGACGGCSTACPGGICSGGTCVTCPAGQMACGVACVDTQTDLNNCGFCGNLCGTQCIDGQCTGVGAAPHACAQTGESCASDPCCVGFCGQDDLCTCVGDGSECAQTGTGGCCDGQPCNASGFCGTCTLFGGTCNSDAECCTGSQYGAALCCFDGVSLTTRCTDVTNIGFVCPGDTPPPESCPAGQTLCGNACADLSSDAGNCGACGNSCGLGGICTGGTCGAPQPTCLVLGSPCTLGVDICCEHNCMDGVCQCAPAGVLGANPGECCSGNLGADGYCL